MFSGGLDGLLTEWDLTSLQASTVSDSNGGAVWSLAVDPQQGIPTLPSHPLIFAPSAHVLSISILMVAHSVNLAFHMCWQDTGARAMHAFKAVVTISNSTAYSQLTYRIAKVSVVLNVQAAHSA